MAISVPGDPFMDKAETVVDEQSVSEAAPSLPDTKTQSLIRAANRESWDKQEGVNEKFLFAKEYVSIASQISQELGPFALDVYERGQNISESAVLRLINEGDRTGSFRGQNARGGSQWDIQQLIPSSLDNSAGPSDRVYQTGTTGNFDVAPGFGGAATNNTASLTNDVQSVVVMGAYASTNPRVVQQIKLDVDDGEERNAFDVFGHQSLGTLQAQNLPSIEYITDDDNYDANGSATSDSTTDAYFFGMDLNTAANMPGLGTSA